LAVVVVGGHSRNIGKTSVVAALIARLPELRWTAFKITQYGHGFCTADGKPCQCQTEDSCVSITAERDATSGTDTSRFLAAGAVRSLWVRTRVGMLAESMPRIRQELAASENAILESNSVLEFLKPDLYLVVVDPSVSDWKDSARRFFSRADAVLLCGNSGASALTIPAETPRFRIAAPNYISEEAVEFVRSRIAREARLSR
jgi:molybdopterin-guanine dinucleotide biosynthesis protein